MKVLIIDLLHNIKSNKNFINISRYIIKIMVLIIHYFTRTPLIVVYYFAVCAGLFGPSNGFTSYCFSFALSLIILNVIVFALFNSSFTKEWCIHLVGQSFFDNYLTHSAPAGRSLLRLGTGMSIPAIAEGVTNWQNGNTHMQSQNNLRNDIERSRYFNDHKAVKASQATLNRVVENYRSGGVVSQAFRSEAAVKTYGIIGDTTKSIVQSITGSGRGR